MIVSRVSNVVLVLSALFLAVGVGPRVTGVAQGLPAVQEANPSEATIPYPGRLSDEAWQPVADGNYDFTFALYSAETGGEALWSEVQQGIPVQAGAFNAMLGEAQAMPSELLKADARWLDVSVRGPDEAEFTALTPRQPLGALSPASQLSPMAASDGGACPHSHWGETWEGDSGWLYLHNTAVGHQVWLPGWLSAIHAQSETWGGVYGQSTANIGVYGQSRDESGILGTSVDGYGVQARSDNSHSVYVPSSGASGVYVGTAGTHGVDVASAAGSGVKVYSAGEDGVHVDSAGWSGVYVASSGYDAIRVQTAGQDGLRFFEGMGRDYIRAGSDADLDFRVENDGTVRADGGFHTGADFAELMAAEGGGAAYEPGDVLVISTNADRSAALSSEPYSTLVLGIYSEAPGFIGSPHPMEPQRDDEVAVAVVGIVPCKVSAENGAIRRGDLLVTSTTLGHAMRGDAPPAGTILDKALEPLDAGTGIIQVLVTLQ